MRSRAAEAAREVVRFECLPRLQEVGGELRVERGRRFVPVLEKEERDWILIVDRRGDAERGRKVIHPAAGEKRGSEAQVLPRAREISDRVGRGARSPGQVELHVLLQKLRFRGRVGKAPRGLQVGETRIDVPEKKRRSRPADVGRRKSRRASEAGIERLARSRVVAFLEIEPSESVVDLENARRVRGERRLQMSLRLVEPARGESEPAELSRILRREREERREVQHHREMTATGGDPRRRTKARPAGRLS